MSDERHRCYISYKFEDEYYKNEIVKLFADSVFIDKSQQETIHSNNPDVIMNEIHSKYLVDTTVTIFLIGDKSYENYRDPLDKIKGLDSQIIIRNEIRASLRRRESEDTRNGLLGIVLPSMVNKVYCGQYICPHCKGVINSVAINDSTVIKEFHKNYYLIPESDKCDHYSDDGRYAILVSWDEFIKNPKFYIDEAFNKRNQKIADYVRVDKFN